MNAVNRDGLAVETNPSGSMAAGVLHDIDAPTIRGFLIDVMKRGGVSLKIQRQVMRCSKAALYRDLRDYRSVAFASVVPSVHEDRRIAMRQSRRRRRRGSSSLGDDHDRHP